MTAEVRASRLRHLAPLFACITGVVALTVVVAWLSRDAGRPESWPLLFVMKFNTAVSLLLAALGLFAASRARPTAVVTTVAGTLLLALSLATLIQHLFQVSLGVDQLVVSDPAQVRYPGRTSPVAATGLACIGLALLLSVARRTSASQLVFFVGSAAPISMLGGYLYNAPRPGTETITSIVAFVISSCLLSLCLGGLFLRANSGLMRVVVSQSRAGAMARILMPVAAAVPVVAGLLIVAAGRSGVMSVDLGSAMLVAFCAIFFTAAVWMTATLLWRAEIIQADAEQQLQITRERLDSALIASEIGTWEWDIVNDRVHADKNLEAMLQVSGDDARGGPITAYFQAIHPDDVAMVKRDIEGAMAQGSVFSSEHRLKKVGGGERWVLARGQVQRNAAGAAIRLSGVVLDISEQRRAEADLRKSEHHRRLALESAGLGMWTLEPATMVLTTDARFREIFGVQADTLAYEDAVALIHPDDRAKIRAAVAATLDAADGAPYDVEHRVVRADGTVRWVHAKGRGNVGGEGRAGGSLSMDGTLADITDRKRAEAEREQLLASERTARAAAERAGRIKDEFLSTLSHEIRTPLSAILGWTQIMRRSKAPQDHAVGLEVIERNARTQSRIIEDLLDMSSIISGKVRLDVQELDLAALVHVGIDTARPTADAKDISITLRVDPHDAVRMMGDVRRMQQVLWNLLSNAIKFTPRGGRIEVAVRRVESHLEIQVTDNGEGISAEFLPFVFDRFRQADASTTRRHGGLGLGLSIVRQIAELHGGSVHASSAGPGQGATFVVMLPIAAVHDLRERKPAADDAQPDEVAETPDDPGSIEGVRILMVDDEADAREVIQRLLQEYGGVVTAAASAAEAMAQLQRGQFDVLLSDIGMPGEDGYSWIRRVRALPAEQGGALPAIALTAFARAEDRARATAAGFDMHLAKPVEVTALLGMIATAVRKAT